MLRNPFFITLLLCFAVWVAMVFMGLGDDGGDTGDHSHADSDHHGETTIPNVLTIRNIMLFGVGFGASGYIASYNGSDFQTWFIVGLIFGTGTAYAGYKFFQVVRKQEGNTLTRLSLLEGKNGRVTTAIPATGFGEIVAQTEFGSAISLSARSQDVASPEGSTVRITSIVGNVATVTITLESVNS